MIPVDIDDILGGLAAAQSLHRSGFSKANNTSPRYREFGQDISNLGMNLDTIFKVVERAQRAAGTIVERRQYTERGSQKSSPVPGSLILANYRETLGDCERLLNDQRYFQRRGGFVVSINWYDQIDPEVQKLRSRIACHNIKLSIVFKIIDPRELRDRSFYIHDSTAELLTEAEQLGPSFNDGKNSEALAEQATPLIVIPKELQSGFAGFVQKAYPDPSSLTLDRSIDAAVSCFNGITQKREMENRYLNTIVNVMTASWMLQAARSGKEYDAAARFPSKTAFDRQMDDWGLTIDRFFDVFQDNLQETLRCLLGRDLTLPPTSDLLEILEKDTPNIPTTLESVSLPNTPSTPNISAGLEVVSLPDMPSIPRKEQYIEDLRRGTKVMKAQLQSPDPNYYQSLEVFSQTKKRSSLTLVNTPLSEGRERETTDNFDLDYVEIIPLYAMRTWTSPSSNPQTMLFRTDSVAPFSLTLVFKQDKNLFEFQQAITGYRVNHDDIRVLATSQEAKLLGGSRRQDLCRLQLWTAPRANIDIAPAAKESSPRSISEMKRGSRNSLTSSPSTTRDSRRKPSSPSLFSSGSRFSKSSRASVVIDAPALPGSTANLIKSVICAPPTPPCVVLFAHKAPTLSARVEGTDISRSFLIVDITPETTIEEELNEYEHEQEPCYRCVLERKSSYLQARRSLETSDPALWDLAAAGRYKREKETEVVKKLKHVILEFDTHPNLLEFVTKFNQVKEIAARRLARNFEATG